MLIFAIPIRHSTSVCFRVSDYLYFIGKLKVKHSAKVSCETRK